MIYLRENITECNPHTAAQTSRELDLQYRAIPYTFGTIFAISSSQVKSVPWPKIILIIEDEPDAREALCEFLRINGFMVVCAENGKAALDEITSHQVEPSLILLDLMMPVMDGDAFIKRAHRDEGARDIPVIITTAHPREDLPRTAGVLVKPIRPERLMQLILRLLCEN